ncbi:MAG: peptidylprolyl isomerase [Eubacteriales bacterium]|nr:peptidylprolyl isomerase [Eubacteriales bacterium]
MNLFSKKLLAAVMALLLMLPLAACQKGVRDGKVEGTTETETQNDEQGAESAVDPIAGLKESMEQTYELGQPFIDEPALEVNGEVLAVKVLNFYAALAAKAVRADLNGNLFSAEGQEILAQPLEKDSEETVRDKVLEYSIRQAIMDKVCIEMAKAENYTSEDDAQAVVDQILGQVTMLALQNDFEPEKLLSYNYGWGVDTELFAELIKNYFYAEQYRNSKAKEYKFTDADLNQEYEENKDKLEQITFRALRFGPDSADYFSPETLAKIEKADEFKPELFKDQAENAELSAEELADNAKLRAESMQKRIKSEDDFVKLQALYATAMIREELAKNPEASLQKLVVEQVPEEMRSFLTDKDRKSGDSEIIESDFGTWLLLYVDKGRNKDKTYTTRQVLISPTDPESDEAWEEAEKKAEELLKEFKKNDPSEEKFAKLANEESMDPGNQGGKGGLYEQVQVGQFVPEYEAWALDPKRQKGDVEIVKTTHGYHIIYFIGLDEEVWKLQVKRGLELKKTKEWLDELIEEQEYKELEGMKYVAPLADSFK